MLLSTSLVIADILLGTPFLRPPVLGVPEARPFFVSAIFMVVCKKLNDGDKDKGLSLFVVYKFLRLKGILYGSNW